MLELPYVAGIVDGEGWIGFQQTRTKHLKVYVRVKMTHEGIITLLHAQFGGSIQFYKKQVEHNQRQTHEWILVQDQAVAFLKNILSWLVVKKEQATLAILYRQTRLNIYKEEDVEIFNLFKTKMHKLNKRGLVLDNTEEI